MLGRGMPRCVPPPAQVLSRHPAPAAARDPDGLPGVSRETFERLATLVRLARHWTRSINLIAPGDADWIWSRHVGDSLRLVPLIGPEVRRAIDLGSGAGFPGLVLAIATGIPFELIEADRRKAAFLVEAARATDAPAQIHCSRIELANVTPAELVTARALAPLKALLDHTYPLLLPRGTALFPKGARVDEELAIARQSWAMQVTRTDDPSTAGSTILAITGLTHA